MVAEHRDRGLRSWGTLLLVKIAILGMSAVVVLWVGWPQPPFVRDIGASFVPVSKSLRVSQLLPTPETGVSSIDALRGSAVNREPQSREPNGALVLVDLNLGSREELESLPGIGEKLAERIMSYRRLHGVFQQVDDIINVSGIGKMRRQQLEPFVTVNAIREERAG